MPAVADCTSTTSSVVVVVVVPLSISVIVFGDPSIVGATVMDDNEAQTVVQWQTSLASGLEGVALP